MVPDSAHTSVSTLRRSWRAGKPGVLPSVGSQRVNHHLATQQQQQQQKGAPKFLLGLKLRLSGSRQTYCPLCSVARMRRVEDWCPWGPFLHRPGGPANGRHCYCRPSPAQGGRRGAGSPGLQGEGTPGVSRFADHPAPPLPVLVSPACPDTRCIP